MTLRSPKFYDPEVVLQTLLDVMNRALSDIEQDKFTEQRAAKVAELAALERRAGAIHHHAQLTHTLSLRSSIPPLLATGTPPATAQSVAGAFERADQ